MLASASHASFRFASPPVSCTSQFQVSVPAGVVSSVESWLLAFPAPPPWGSSSPSVMWRSSMLDAASAAAVAEAAAADSASAAPAAAAALPAGSSGGLCRGLAAARSSRPSPSSWLFFVAPRRGEASWAFLPRPDRFSSMASVVSVRLVVGRPSRVVVNAL